jgi:hypothetical protein
MAPMIALVVAVVVCLVLFPREVAQRDLNPLIIALLVITLLILTQGNGNTVELGPALWGSHWLPQMLGIAIVFLFVALPGPKLLALLKDYRSSANKALISAVIGVLTCVLASLIAITVASRGFVTPLFMNW